MSPQDKKRKAKNNREDVFDREYPWDRPEKRVRFVDFQRIEDNRNENVLTPYELEVKKAIACVPSPYDELVRQEEESEKGAHFLGNVNHLVL